ncbi:MAG: hypothetical protein F4Z04_05530 [Acidobacteria bacterium]|nr:hypothetical protein [Acidobacteriota bacterium]
MASAAIRLVLAALTMPGAAGGGAPDTISSAGELVEALSGGRLAVEVDTDGGSCGAPDACLDALVAGEIDIYLASTPEAARFVPEFHVLDVPYLLESDAVVELVFTGVFFERMRDALLGESGLRLLGLSGGGGWRGIATRAGPVRSPEDLRGVTLGTGQSPVLTAWARAVGATPAPVAWSNRAATGPAAGIEGRAGSVIDLAKVDGDAGFRHLTRDDHGYPAGLWLMREEAYQALPVDLRQVMNAAFGELARLARAEERRRTAAAVAAFEAAGGVVHVLSSAERRAFVMAAGRVSTGYMEQHGHEWMVWFEGAIAAAERQIALTGGNEEARP